jgi:hypothetical protein
MRRGSLPLSQIYVDVIQVFFVEGHSYTTTAEYLGVSTRAVRDRIQYIRRFHPDIKQMIHPELRLYKAMGCDQHSLSTLEIYHSEKALNQRARYARNKASKCTQ